MYEKYWSLKEKPFENTPDPRFLYHSPNHEEALMRMFYAVKERKGAALLTGDYGSGKTVLSRALISDLSKHGEKYKIALIVNPRLPTRDFLREIIYQMEGEEIKGNKIKLLHILNERLYKNIDLGKETVIIIDEAQAIEKPAIFEELRLLLNFQLNERFLLTLILLGQPELKPKIKAIPQLEQRLAVKYHLSSLDEQQTAEYINHRCKVAGLTEPIFTPSACGLIFSSTGGVPRKINNVCDMSLIVGMMEKVKLIDDKILKKVVEDVVI
jgi:general secretion pathway protein A